MYFHSDMLLHIAVQHIAHCSAVSKPWKVLVKEESLNSGRCLSTINGACTSGILYYVYILVCITIRQTRDDGMFSLGSCSLLAHFLNVESFFFPKESQNMTLKRTKGSRHLWIKRIFSAGNMPLVIYSRQHRPTPTKSSKPYAGLCLAVCTDMWANCTH